VIPVVGLLMKRLPTIRRNIQTYRPLKRGQRLHTEADDGDHDTGNRKQSERLRRSRTGRLLTEQPHTPLPGRVG